MPSCRRRRRRHASVCRPVVPSCPPIGTMVCHHVGTEVNSKTKLEIADMFAYAAPHNTSVHHAPRDAVVMSSGRRLTCARVPRLITYQKAEFIIRLHWRVLCGPSVQLGWRAVEPSSCLRVVWLPEDCDCDLRGPSTWWSFTNNERAILVYQGNMGWPACRLQKCLLVSRHVRAGFCGGPSSCCRATVVCPCAVMLSTYCRCAVVVPLLCRCCAADAVTYASIRADVPRRVPPCRRVPLSCRATPISTRF